MIDGIGNAIHETFIAAEMPDRNAHHLVALFEGLATVVALACLLSAIAAS